MTVIYRIAHAPAPAFHARAMLGAPGVISDEMAPTQSMLDGKYYTSKAALRRTYRPSGNAEGARFAEVGNDPSLLRPRSEAYARQESHQGVRRQGLRPRRLR